MNYILPLLSVILGYATALIVKPKKKNNLKLLLAFSGSFLLSLTVMHLLPDVYKSDNPTIGLFIMGGILFQIILEIVDSLASENPLDRNVSIRVG